MTLEEFLASRPGVTRCLQRYDSYQRADRAASHRLGHRQREAIGEFFYTNDEEPTTGYPTAKAAKVGLHRALLVKAWQDGFVVPLEATAGHPGLRESLIKGA